MVICTPGWKSQYYTQTEVRTDLPLKRMLRSRTDWLSKSQMPFRMQIFWVKCFKNPNSLRSEFMKKLRIHGKGPVHPCYQLYMCLTLICIQFLSSACSSLCNPGNPQLICRVSHFEPDIQYFSVPHDWELLLYSLLLFLPSACFILHFGA